MTRYYTLIVLLVAGAGGCATSSRRSSVSGGPLSHVAIPESPLTAATYRDAREAFDALPLDHPQRQTLREHLERYLSRRLNKDLRHHETSAYDSFKAAATLYEPTEVYGGSLRDPLLYSMAGEIVAAYRPTGDVRRVLPALAVQLGLKPSASSPRREYETILRWLERTGDSEDEPNLQGWRSVRVLERALDVWPSRLVVETLCATYEARLNSLKRISPRELLRRHPQLNFAALRATGYNIARTLLWVDQPREALDRVRKVVVSGRDSILLNLLQNVTAPEANAEAVLQLATAFEEAQPELALKICRRGTVRFPQAAALHSCVGELAGRMDNITLSVAAFEAAARLQPQSRTAAERLANQYQRQIFRLIERERLEPAQQRLEHIEHFYSEAATRLGKPIDPPLARVYFALGYGLYNAGRVAEAQRTLERALKPKPLPEALIQLATIETKLEHGAAARRYLDRAIAQLPATSPMSRYWSARIATLRAQSLDIDGKGTDEQTAWREAARAWTSWLRFDLLPEARAEALVYMAHCLYGLGQQGEAIESLEHAIDAAPDRKETYADALAFLTARGHLPEALDAYHRALGRPEVTEYLKAYCSFWVINLARRAGVQPDPLAVRFLHRLESRGGNSWYHRLAPFVLGTKSYADLLPLAKTPSERAELSFYQAERLLAAGQPEKARALWKQVVATRMVAFFEYDMALYDLRHGAAKVAVKPIEHSTAEENQNSDNDGAI